MIFLHVNHFWLCTLADGATFLHIAAAKGLLDVVQVLVEGGAAVDPRDLDGWTPLHAAAAWKSPSVVHCLVSGGADVLALVRENACKMRGKY